MDETTAIALIEPEVPSPKPAKLPPGHDLTPFQRQAVQLSVIVGEPNAKVAGAVGVSERSIQRWRSTPWWREYGSYLVETVEGEARLHSRAKLARWLPQSSDQLGMIAAGVIDAKSPYQVNASEALHNRVRGKPGQTAEVGVKVPTEHGDVIIVFRSKGV